MSWQQFVEYLSGAAATLGLKPSFLAGVFGAVVSLRFVPDMKTTGQRLSMVLSGALVAGYTAPLTVALFEVKGQGAEASLSFLIGLFGMSLAAAVIKMINDGAFGELVKSKLGGGAK